MSSSSEIPSKAHPELPFKPPPIVECISQGYCLSIGKKVHAVDKICTECLKRHDPQQLRIWADSNPAAVSLIADELSRKQETKANIESHGRYLCAFEDPDFEDCRWRRRDLNLRGTRMDCGTVRRKGSACEKCWRRHLQKIGIVQYFTPTGLCHEEADKVPPKAEGSGSGSGSVTAEKEEEEGIDDDVEGYDIVMS